MNQEFSLMSPTDESEKKPRRARNVEILPPVKGAMNRQNPGQFPVKPPISVQMLRDWREVSGADAKGSYYMVAKWDEIPPDIVRGLVDEGHGPGTYLLADAAGNKSRWAVTPHHVRIHGAGVVPVQYGDDEPADPADRIEKALDMMDRLRERIEPPRAENPIGPPPVDWAKLLMSLAPMFAPLVKVLSDKIAGVAPAVAAPTPPPVTSTASTASSAPDGWEALRSMCAAHGIQPDEIAASILAHVETATSAGGVAP